VEQCLQANEYITQNVAAYSRKTNKTPGKFEMTSSLAQAVENAWLVIECVPEKLEAKTKIFGELTTLARRDAILATNSSSYRSSEMLGEVPEDCKNRILNMHYYMPPSCMVVELMTDGFTDPAIIEYLVDRSREVGTLPYVARIESTGFIFNRLWAAVKRETLTILAEGVSTPEEIDSMWTEMFVKGGSLPCKTMDGQFLHEHNLLAHTDFALAVGLDTVAFIESHYVAERGLSPEMTVDYLKRNFLDAQKLGNKSANGGLYPPTIKEASTSQIPAQPRILALDIGLSSTDSSTNTGEIVELTPDGQVKSLVKNQALPDGLTIDSASRRMFWTCMGSLNKQDGALYSADLDGSNIKTVLAPGAVHTPKQLNLDTANQMIYFCDREGQGVFRCKYDGSQLQQLVNNNSSSQHGAESDVMGWCVGIALSSSLNKLYWTQKGPSKGGKGRIFSANLPSTNSPDAEITNARCLLDNLPEPIDLEIDEETRSLYWTDRGELPRGNTLNRIQLSEDGAKPSGTKEILAKKFHEAIGLRLDLSRRQVFVTDLGGSIYSCKIDEDRKIVLHRDERRAFTGVTCI
jgi:3-hydroxyacyl-CoA dehydrogenase